jgi:hypothetical protein
VLDWLVQLDARVAGEPDWQNKTYRAATPRHIRTAPRPGVALPTLWQAWRAHRTDADGRAVWHRECPHLNVDCPVEAALSATIYRRQVIACWAIAIVGWAVTGLAVIFAGHSVFPTLYSDNSSFPALVGMLALVWTLTTALWAGPEGNEMSHQAAAVAARGPDINPWTADR